MFLILQESFLCARVLLVSGVLRMLDFKESLIYDKILFHEKKPVVNFMKATKSLCPECLGVIDAKIFEEHGKIMLEKTCSHHGSFKDIYWSNAEQFKRFDS